MVVDSCNYFLRFCANDLEKELIEIASAPEPPTQAQIRSIAHRLDAHQKQLQQALERIKDMMTEIDKETDAIQKPRSNW